MPVTYRGGQSMPAVGTSAYRAAQTGSGYAPTTTTTSSRTSTPTTSSSSTFNPFAAVSSAFSSGVQGLTNQGLVNSGQATYTPQGGITGTTSGGQTVTLNPGSAPVYGSSSGSSRTSGGGGSTSSASSQPVYTPPVPAPATTQNQAVVQTEPTNTNTNYVGPTNTNTALASNAGSNLSGLIQQLIQQSQMTPEEQAARQAAAQLQADAAQEQANISNTPIDMSFQTGRIQNLQTLAAAKQGALQSKISALAAQRGVTSDALNRAIGFNMPQQVPYGTQFINPITGQSALSPESQGQWNSTMENYANMAANGQGSAIPSSITSNSVLNDQINQRARQINPNYNPLTTSALGGLQAGQTVDQAKMQTALNQVDEQTRAFNSSLASSLNSSDINVINRGIQAIASNTSNPQYNNLYNYVTSIANAYKDLTNNPQTPEQIISLLSSGKSITDVINNLKSSANARISQAVGATPNPTGGSSTSTIGNTTFRFVNGQWTY